MRPSVEACLQSLATAAKELESALGTLGAAKAAVAEADKLVDLARRARLNAEQELKQAIRDRVGGPGEIF